MSVQLLKCDGCATEGVLCATVDGEILDAKGRLVDHPEVGKGAVILVAGRSDGSEIDKVFCEDCAAFKYAVFVVPVPPAPDPAPDHHCAPDPAPDHHCAPDPVAIVRGVRERVATLYADASTADGVLCAVGRIDLYGEITDLLAVLERLVKAGS